MSVAVTYGRTATSAPRVAHRYRRSTGETPPPIAVSDIATGSH